MSTPLSGPSVAATKRCLSPSVSWYIDAQQAYLLLTKYVSLLKIEVPAESQVNNMTLYIPSIAILPFNQKRFPKKRTMTQNLVIT